MANLYETDGHCHNAEPGTYGHECGKPAEWIGENASGFRSGFCDDCKRNGYEAKGMVSWSRRSVNLPQNGVASWLLAVRFAD